ncbi:unnamed protein product [Adineta steineri]|uniref:Uncharacterized protein n=1 Tax=Adineta steineri TaxID=433720 RepID=A0A815PPT4_9BILA|nr:unnamed protein product [Adineta steineri]
MMTEKYYTLPSSSSSSSSFCYSTIYHSSSTTNHIHDIKNHLNFQKNISSLYEPTTTDMKLLIGQQPTVRTHSLHDVQERIDYFENKKLIDDNEHKLQEKVLSNPSSTSSAETLQSVIANTLQQTFFNGESYGSAVSRTMMNSTNGNNNQSIAKRRSLSSGNLFASNEQKRFNRYSSSLSKRVRTYSLSNHLTMAITAITSFSEEQPTEPQETMSMDYENTYFYPEETTRFDDGLSLTTITSNIPAKITNTQHDTSVCSDTTVFQSDTDENSDVMISAVKHYGNTYDINMTPDLQNENNANNDEQIIRIRLSLTPPDQHFSGMVHATKYTVVKEKECLSDYGNTKHYVEHNNKIRSNVDNVSLNKSMTSSMQHDHCRRISADDEQLNQQEKRTNDNINDSNTVNQQAIVQSIKMNNGIEMMTQQETSVSGSGGGDDDDDDGHYSDESNYSEDLRYSSDAARNSCTSDDLNNTSSTLRQEAISITRVRCKRRKTWIRSPSSPTRSPNNNNNSKPISYLQQRRLKTNLIQPFLSNNQVDETDACQNINSNSTTTPKTSTRIERTMLLHNNSLNCNTNQNKNIETSSYNFIPINNNNHHHHHTIKTDESSLLNISSTSYQDTSSPKINKKTNEYYSSSLSPIKHLLNESIDSNIEIIQMDEQECILEIVDGVLTIVPKDKSISSSIDSTKDKKRINHNSSKYQNQRSSSIASSASTPSLSEQEPERDESSSISSSKPYHIVLQDNSITKPSSFPQTDPPSDVLDLFSAPITSKNQKNLLDDSLSSVSSYSAQITPEIKKQQQQTSIPRSSSPIHTKSKSSSSKSKTTTADTSSSSVENQTRSNKNTLLSELLQTVKKSPPSTNETEIEKPKSNSSSLSKTESTSTPKPINKDRINEFASLLSSSVHLSQPQTIQKPIKSSTTTKKSSSSSTIRSEERSSSSIPSANTERDERESYHTVKSNNSEENQTKKHIDARYNERLDDRGSIKVKTANIKALFEQKISDTNKALSQSSEHLLHLTEVKQQQQQHHKKVPISYGSLKRNIPNYPQTGSNNNNRRQSYNQDTLPMNKYTDHIVGTKDVVIEDKQPENALSKAIRRNTTESVVYSTTTDPSANASMSPTNGYYSETLIAREIRQTKQKEEELKRQRKKCGFIEDGSGIMSNSTNDSIKSESTLSTNQSVKNSSFLSNLDFFTSKAANNSSTESISSPRRSIVSIQNHTFEPQQDDSKQMHTIVSQELNRFNENGVSINRTSSTNGILPRSTSNQNILATQNSNNIIQREIEAIRAKEAELRQLGRIQHTSDEHADPRKYQELVSTLPKSQSIQTISTGKTRRDSENQQLSRSHGPTNGLFKPKLNNNNNSPLSSVRNKFPSPNPNAPVVSSTNKIADYSKLSTTDRLEYEKRQCQEREQELKKQRSSISASTSSTNTTINGDSGNVSQEEHDDDQERYFDKIERLKRTENEKAQAPLVRPPKKLDMSQKWEQMMANKIDD